MTPGVDRGHAAGPLPDPPIGTGNDRTSPLTDDAVVILARHGRTQLNAGGLLRGHLDPALDSVGEAEVAALADELAQLLAPRSVARIGCSPLRRAVQTAQAIAAALPTPPPVEIEQGLLDRDYGRWAGHSRSEVEAHYGNLDAADGVEPAEVVTQRARTVLDAQLPLLTAGPVVLVAHDAVNRLLLASLDPSLGPADDIGQATACWNLLSYRDGIWHVERVDQQPPVRATHRERGPDNA